MALATACAKLLGCSYDFDAPFSSPTNALADGGDTSPADGGGKDTGNDDASNFPDAAPPTCDAQEKPVASAIFVSNVGGSDGAAGTSASPVKSLAKATELATISQVEDIYIDEGTYGEVVSMRSAVVLHGGWIRNGASWTRDCKDGAHLRTLINPPTATVLDVAGFTGNAGIEDVTLVTNLASGELGESMMAVSIVGTGVRFHAVNVDVTAAKGGNGAVPVHTGDPGALTCNGHSDCATGGEGSPGSNGAPAQAGEFRQSGYVPGDGQQGTEGSPGGNGTAGGEGNTASGCDSCGSPPACETIATVDLTSGEGSCGCGGKPGLAGAAGKGGGASVGIYVAGQGTTLTVFSSVVRASNGGDGTAGLTGPGGTGSAGETGYSPFCGSCVYMAPGCGLSGGWVSGGSAGGPGGAGGAGGKGGGGSGGPSYGIVAVAGANAVVDAQTQQAIIVGKGGSGADGAPSGGAAPVLIAP